MDKPLAELQRELFRVMVIEGPAYHLRHRHVDKERFLLYCLRRIRWGNLSPHARRALVWSREAPHLLAVLRRDGLI